MMDAMKQRQRPTLLKLQVGISVYAGGHFGHTAKTTAVAQGIVGDLLLNRESGVRYSLTCRVSGYKSLSLRF